MGSLIDLDWADWMPAPVPENSRAVTVESADAFFKVEAE